MEEVWPHPVEHPQSASWRVPVTNAIVSTVASFGTFFSLLYAFEKSAKPIPSSDER